MRAAPTRAGAQVVVADSHCRSPTPDQVVEAILAAVTPRTRLAVISHVTSPTGLVFPIQRDRQCPGRARHRHARRWRPRAGHGPTRPDAAQRRVLHRQRPQVAVHAQGQRVSCTSAAIGRPRFRPLVISHGTNSPRSDRTRFRLEFDWAGTGDPTPTSSIPAALDFMGGLLDGGWSEAAGFKSEPSSSLDGKSF